MNAITLLKTDHGNVEALFKQFEALGRDGDPADKRRVVDHIIEQLSVHAAVEELEELGDAMEQAKATAPTRPHPFTPDQPPLQTLIAMPVAVLDRLVTTGRKAVEDVVAEIRKRAA